MTDDRPELEDLVADFVERRENGEAIDPEEFAARHPDQPGLRKALDTLIRMQAMFPEGELAAKILGVPERIGPWRVLDELGRGGSGRVFRVAHADAADAPPVALKLLHPGLANDPRRMQRFEREARVLADLDGEGIVRIHGVGEHEGCPFLVMDLIEGEPCDEATELPGPGDRWQRAARVVAEVADALAGAHAAGVLHRDLKPGNVVLRRDGRPVVIDFGLVRDANASTLTRTGDILGTPAFMAPEQAVGAAVDERTDVYGLGAILYQLVTGRAPHAGEDPVSVLRTVGERPAPPPRAVAKSVPAPLDGIIRRAMAFRPSRRFDGASDLAAALRAFAAGGALPPGSTQGIGGRIEDAWRWHRRAVMAMAMVGLLGLGGWLTWSWLDQGWVAERTAQRAALVRTAARARLDGDWDQARAAAVQLEGAGDHPLGPYLRRAETVADPVALALRDGDRRGSDPAAAADAYAKGLGMGHSDGLVAGLAGLARVEAGDHERAVADLEVARRAFPGSWAVADALAQCHLEAKRHAEAASLFEVAAGLSGEHSMWHEAAKCWAKADNQERGLAALDRALELVGDSVPPEYRRTEAACVGAPDRSAEILVDLIGKHPRMASLHYNLGFVLHNEHRLAEAVERYAEAAALDRGAVHARLMLAWIHGGMDRGCELCDACLAKSPELLDRGAARVRLEETVALSGGEDRNVLATLKQVAEANDLVEVLDTAVGAYLNAPPDGATEKELGRLLRFRQKLR